VSKSADNIYPLKPTAPRPDSLKHGAESFDLGHVLVTPIDAAKRAETVYLDSTLGAQAAPISLYPPLYPAPTSQLDYPALFAPLPSDESSAASINSSTDLSDSDSDSNSDMADINPSSLEEQLAKTRKIGCVIFAIIAILNHTRPLKYWPCLKS